MGNKGRFLEKGKGKMVLREGFMNMRKAKYKYCIVVAM